MSGESASRVAFKAGSDKAFYHYRLDMSNAARRIQGDHYVGDPYYMQEDAWRNNFDEGTPAEDAVREDMTYWDEPIEDEIDEEPLD